MLKASSAPKKYEDGQAYASGLKTPNNKQQILTPNRQIPPDIR